MGKTASHEDTMAFCETGSLQPWVEQELLKKLNLDGEEVAIHLAGIHGPQQTQSKTVQNIHGKVVSISANTCSILRNSQKNTAVGKK